MNDSGYIWSGAIDRRMDESLDIHPRAARDDGFPVPIECQDVRRADQRRCHVPGQIELVRLLFISYADMAEPVQYPLVVKDMVRGREFLCSSHR